MRDEDLRQSDNIEDRRGQGGRGGFGGGGGQRLGMGGGGGLGLLVPILMMLTRSRLGWAVLIIGGIAFFAFGGLGSITGLSGAGQSSEPGGYQASDTNAASQGVDANASRSQGEARTASRVSAVLASTEDFWGAYFQREGQTYPNPTLVLFDNQTASPCGTASGATGPFYCPGDKKIYLDMSFFDEMDRGLGAKGDFAQAYVIAHEVGHHVQDVLGILPQAHRAMRARGEAKGEGSVAVRVELQADCFAGLWAAKSTITATLEPGDLEEALGAAAAVGDDRLQKRAQGYAVPDSFTHGSSEQRARWFMKGLRGADLTACDTFRAREL
jgi:uncharacterized protein